MLIIINQKKIKTNQERLDEFEKEWDNRRKPLEEKLAKLQENADKTTVSLFFLICFLFM